MKQNPTHDKHIALGMIAAYAVGMLMMAAFFGINSFVAPNSSTSQAALDQNCPPAGVSPEVAQWYISSGQCN